MDYKASLLKADKKVFKTDDLSVLWEITNRNTLRTTIKRYLNKNVLFSIRKGVYSVVPPKDLNPYLLGTAYLKGFCYVSLQSVLEKHGLINQVVQKITLVGKRTKSFSVGGNEYLCKKMKPEYLQNTTGINLDKEYPFATVERAIADILYYNSNFHFDADITKYEEKVNTIKQKVFQ